MKHIEYLKVYTADPFPETEHTPPNISKRISVALIMNDISGHPRNELPAGYDHAYGVKIPAYALTFDLSDDVYYINKHHHIAVRGAEFPKNGNEDLCFILCERAVVSQDRDTAISEALNGKFIMHHPDGSIREIVPAEVLKVTW